MKKQTATLIVGCIFLVLGIVSIIISPFIFKKNPKGNQTPTNLFSLKNGTYIVNDNSGQENSATTSMFNYIKFDTEQNKVSFGAYINDSTLNGYYQVQDILYTRNKNSLSGRFSFDGENFYDVNVDILDDYTIKLNSFDLSGNGFEYKYVPDFVLNNGTYKILSLIINDTAFPVSDSDKNVYEDGSYTSTMIWNGTYKIYGDIIVSKGLDTQNLAVGKITKMDNNYVYYGIWFETTNAVSNYIFTFSKTV